MMKYIKYIGLAMCFIVLTGCGKDTEEPSKPVTYQIDFEVGDGSTVESLFVESGETVELPTSKLSGYVFKGWIYNDTLLDNEITVESDMTLTAKWELYDFSDVEDYIATLLPDLVSEDIALETSYNGYEIVWNSNMDDVLDDTGKYMRPYTKTVVELKALITKEHHSIEKMYELKIEPYKSLDGPILSSYVYRDYNFVSNDFFTTLDIINCAFITADSDGNLVGASVLSNINKYIMPKAKENGNWVVFSVAPSSEWSSIVSSQIKVNAFADNIVEMINTFGFDGVDIDWETPRDSEKEKFTDMMEVIYTKVKENNPNHLVTAAISGGMWQPQNYDLEHSIQYMDYVNMMTYGMTTNNGYYQNALFSSRTYNDSTNKAGKTLTSCSIEESVEIFNTLGVENSKIIVGVAFYGIKQERSYDQSTSTWSSWVKGGSVSYNYISNVYLEDDDYQYVYDANAGVPYLMKKDGTVFISYDNPRSIIDKSEYIIESGLAGMMYWENGHDLTGALLSAMARGFEEE